MLFVKVFLQKEINFALDRKLSQQLRLMKSQPVSCVSWLKMTAISGTSSACITGSDWIQTILSIYQHVVCDED
jgi:hypothetical protein